MFLLQMAGHPGSGKSTLARRIAKETNCIVLDRDIIKTAMIQTEVSKEVINRASYRVLFDLANSFMMLGMSVIIDTPCYYEEILTQGQDLAKKMNSKYRYVECKVNDFDLIEKRILARTNLVSQISKVSIESYIKSLNRSIKPKESGFMIVDTTSDDNYCINSILEYIEDGGLLNE